MLFTYLELDRFKYTCHNHPEGIKAAEATCAAIYLASTGAEKSYIKKYIEDEFHYDLSRTLDEIRPTYHHVELAQKTVPEAITAFLEGESFEDTVRNAVSLGGDTDTLAAIAGAIAEAYYGISGELKAECLERITGEMADVISDFNKFIDGSAGAGTMFGHNEFTASSYNAMVPYIDNEVSLKDFPFINQLSRFEKDLYQRCFDQLITERRANPEIPLHLDTIEKDWD